MRIEIKHRFTGAVLYADEGESVRHVLEKAVRKRANLVGAYLGGAYLVGANLVGAYLGGAYLVGADLGGADLGGAYLGGANLVDANLVGAYLSGADLGGAYLVGAYLGGADLGGAYLGGAYLGGANLGGAKIHDVPVAGALLGYRWHFVQFQDPINLPLLRYGCECHSLVDWRADLRGICKRHVSGKDVDVYERAIGALVCLCEALPAVVAKSAGAGDEPPLHPM